MKRRAGLLALILASLAPAQVAPAQPAYLSFELEPSGEVRATLTVPAESAGPVAAAFARAVGCQPNDVQPEQFAARLSVRCRVGHPGPGGLHTQVLLSELAEPLRALGVKQLLVGLVFPRLGDVTITPAIAGRRNYRTASYPLDAVPPVIAIDRGIDPAQVRTLGAGIAGLILLPFVLLLAKPRTLIHLIAMTQALFLLGWAGWTWVLLATQASTLVELLWGNAYAAPLLLLAPPLAAVWVGSRLGAIRYERLAPAGANIALYRKAKFCNGAMVALLFAMVFGMFAAPDTGMFVWPALGLGGALLCVMRLRFASRGASHPLAAGELRDRISALATRAGVRIRGVTILTGAETRPPAAFATRWGGILLTDGLLKRLSKREVDAVVCHELSHTGPQSRVMKPVLYVVVVGTTMTAQFVPGTVMLFPLMIVAAALAFKAWRRSMERTADRDSVRWSGDPEAMISGLARVSLASGMPLEWRAPMSWMLSHPSTGERLRLVAAAGGVPQSRIAELIEQAQSEAPDHYEVTTAVPQGAAFSPALRQRLSNSLSLYALAAPVLLGVGIARALERAGLTGVAVLAIGAPVSMVAFYLGYEMIVGKMRGIARRRAIAANGAGIFAGFSPSPEARIFDGMYHYDFGLVRFSDGLLEFAGDRARFTLDSRLVERVWMGDGPRHWTPRKIVCVEYRNGEGTNTVSLQSFEARIWPWTTFAARSLYRQVEAWRARESTTLAAPSSCDIPRVQGDPDRSAGISAVAKSATIFGGIGLAVSSMFGMAGLERGFDFTPAILCAALAIFAAWPRVMKPRTR